MTPEERMEKATKLKEEGTSEFTAGNHQTAAELYKKASELVDEEEGEILPDQEKDMYVKCLGNAAMCYVKAKAWSDVIQCCNQVLNNCPEESKTNIKILYRRGLAKMHTGELKDAKVDLMAAYEIDNKNKDVRKAIADLKTKFADAKAKEKSAFGGIFGKVSMYNDKEGVFVPNAKGTNPHVFFDVSQGDDSIGRIVMQLYEGELNASVLCCDFIDAVVVLNQLNAYCFTCQTLLQRLQRTSELCAPVKKVKELLVSLCITRVQLSTVLSKTL